jgi:aerotaxis receptor
MQDLTEADVPGPCNIHSLAFHDGTHRTVRVVDEEVPFPDGRLIVSRTDLAGVITHCNQSFVDMSGYGEAEIVGQPHHLLRHPDMPKAAFEDLWSTVQRGEKWSGYVKNLRKDGRFYWVLATVIPNVRQGQVVGFTSVRRKPSQQRVAAAVSDYAAMLAADKP